MEELTGQVFGRLTITAFAGVHTSPNGTKKYKWSWVCACGAAGSSAAGDLKSGRSRSCGCLQREVATEYNAADLAGQRFGRLLVLGRSGRPGRLSWACVCDCGEEAVVRTAQLRSGHTASCGCLRAGETAVRRKEVITYSSAHFRLRRKFGSASTFPCIDCGNKARDWSYGGGDPNELTEEINGALLRYSLNQEYYSPRCKPCHKNLDNAMRRLSA